MIVEGTQIYSNGVILEALKVTINGVEQVRWVAISFEDVTYHNGEEIDVYTHASDFSTLFIEDK